MMMSIMGLRVIFLLSIVLSTSVVTAFANPIVHNNNDGRHGVASRTTTTTKLPKMPSVPVGGGGVGRPSRVGGLKGSAALAQYAPAAISLFGNMMTPASILAGGMVPIGFAAQLPFDVDGKESKLATALRKLFPILCVGTLSSQLCAIMWASVAVNQLTETKVALASSVWDLLQRDYALEWAAVNAHFVMGMMGFFSVIGIKGFFMANQGVSGLSAAGLAMSGFVLLTSIVNRGVAAGGGDATLRYGTNVLSLIRTYATLLFKRSLQSFGPLEWVAVVLAAVSAFGFLKFVWTEVQNV